MDYDGLLRELQKVRKEKRISLRKLGAELGISAQALSLIERGKLPLKLREYCRICESIGVAPSALILKYEKR